MMQIHQESDITRKVQWIHTYEPRENSWECNTEFENPSILLYHYDDSNDIGSHPCFGVKQTSWAIALLVPYIRNSEDEKNETRRKSSRFPILIYFWTVQRKLKNNTGFDGAQRKTLSEGVLKIEGKISSTRIDAWKTRINNHQLRLSVGITIERQMMRFSRNKIEIFLSIQQGYTIFCGFSKWKKNHIF